MVEEDSRWVSLLARFNTRIAQENCRGWRLNLRWNGFWTSGWLVLRSFGGADVAAQVGNPHFLQACNPLDDGKIHYQGHAAEFQGRACTPYFYFFGRRLWYVILFNIATVMPGYYWNKIHKRSSCTCSLWWTSQENGLFGWCRFCWKIQWIKKTWWVICVMTSGGALCCRCLCCVELVPLNFFLMRNFIVASVFGRYLATSSAVNPCHDVKA